MNMRYFALAILLAVSFSVSGQYGYAEPVASAASYDAYKTNFSFEEQEEINRRLRDMDCVIDVRNHPITQSYVRGYMLRYREKSEIILGRIPTYFPIFEEELRKAGLPENLKYLAVVESALDPKAKSRTSAGGLWQFMPGTAAMFDLQVNSTIDERSDVRKSTQAAVQYLKDEYERFGDWALVLAAYNGGPGRVRRAIRRSGKSNFWELRKFLPRETRNYVPAFVAATYLHEYGHLHGLAPRVLTLDEQLITTVECPFGVNLSEVAKATNLPLSLVKSLNTHCQKDYVPAGQGASCRVPARTAPALRSFIKWRMEGTAPQLVEAVLSRAYVSDSLFNSDHLYRERYIKTRAGERLNSLAMRLGVSKHHLRLWNPGLVYHSSSNETIRIFEPRFIPKTPFDVPKKTFYSRLSNRPLHTLAVKRPILPKALNGRYANSLHYLKRYESLLEVWQERAATMTWQEFVKWNNITASSKIDVGTPLNVRE